MISFRVSPSLSHRLNRFCLVNGLALSVLVVAVLCPPAQLAAQASGMQVLDASALKPPVGSRVAIIEFADLQCPACAATNPYIVSAVAKYKIPLVRHDFLIPMHNWSRFAAINARWFDLKSKDLGEEYRNQVFANQSSIYNPDSLREFTQKFADSHKIAWPVMGPDPQGKIAAELQADNDLSVRTGIHSTPTVFIVEASGKGAPFTQVRDPKTGLFSAIDQALSDTRGK